HLLLYISDTYRTLHSFPTRRSSDLDSIKSVFADGVERMILSVESLLPKTPYARDEAIDVVCRMLGALVLARAMPASSSLGRELLGTATECCRKSAMSSSKRRQGGRGPRRQS